MRKAYGQHEAFALAGMPETAKWWGNLLQDLSGDVRGDIRSTMLDKSNAIKYAIYKGVNKESKSWTEAVGWNTANATTKLMSGWQTAMYPAYLGLNAKPPYVILLRTGYRLLLGWAVPMDIKQWQKPAQVISSST